MTPTPDEKPNQMAIGWKTYGYLHSSLDCFTTVIDENLRAAE